MGFFRQEYWSGLPCPPPGDLPDPGIELRSPILQADSLPTEPSGKSPKNSKRPSNSKEHQGTPSNSRRKANASQGRRELAKLRTERVEQPGGRGLRRGGRLRKRGSAPRRHGPRFRAVSRRWRRLPRRKSGLRLLLLLLLRLFGSGGGGGAAAVVPASPPPPPRPIPGLAALAGRGTVVVDAAPASEKVSSRPGGGGGPGLQPLHPATR